MFRLYGWSSGGKKKRAREIICLSGAEVNVARWTKWSLHALAVDLVAQVQHSSRSS